LLKRQVGPYPASVIDPSAELQEAFVYFLAGEGKLAVSF
jgi:hypothetical protein